MKYVYSLAIVLLSFVGSYAKQKDSLVKPKYLLVMLRSDKNRIEAAKKMNNTTKLQEIIRESDSVRSKMVADLNDNFTFCRVYYFMDSNWEKIEKKEYSDLLKDKDGNVLDGSVLNNYNHVILYYGSPDKIYRYYNIIDTTKESGLTEVRMGKGYVVCDSRLQAVSYLYKYDYGMLGIRSLSENIRRYYYKSKKYSMEYVPFASHLDRYFRKKDDAKFIARIF